MKMAQYINSIGPPGNSNVFRRSNQCEKMNGVAGGNVTG
jgi:hypothetical protein